MKHAKDVLSFQNLFNVGVFVFLLIIGSGCASVKKVDTGKRGLFQASVDAAPKNMNEFIYDEDQLRKYGFVWPIKQGSISSFFGKRKRDFHEGIDIRTNRGTPVYAVKSGLVIYSSRRIHGYGNMIVIKHEDGISTVYAHNRKNLVKRGEKVLQGQLIGLVGATGKATGPHLHFEVRKGEFAQDPLLFLPQMRSPAMAHQ